MSFEITPDVEVHRDADGRVTQLKHTRQAYSAAAAGLEEASPVEVARSYVREVAPLYGISEEEAAGLEAHADGEPASEPTRLKEDEQRTVIDTTVVKYQQTHLGLPVWNSTFTVIVAGDPPAVVSSNSTLHQDVEVPDVPTEELAGLSDVAPASLSEAIGVDDSVGSGFSFNGSRMLVYQYDPDARIDRGAHLPEDAAQSGLDAAGTSGEPGDAGAEGGEPVEDEPTEGGAGGAGFDPSEGAGPEGAGSESAATGFGDDGGAGPEGPGGEGAASGFGGDGPGSEGPGGEGPGGEGPGGGSASGFGGEGSAGDDGPGGEGPSGGGSASGSGGGDSDDDGAGGDGPGGEGPSGHDRAGTEYTADLGGGAAGGAAPFQQGPPTLPLPPVPDSIEPGRHYVVREVLFSLTLPGEGQLNWRAFVEPDTGAVLYLRALTAGATCAVFETDPITKTGNALTPASPAAQLDPARTLGLTLMNLDAPAGGVQSLAGTWARLQDTDPPTVAPPTATSPFSFTYSAVTDNFSAANAYYHTDWMYRLVEGMGFNVITYFDGTSFPVPVDHRGKSGALNASANGNATGNGMGRFLYGLAQSGTTVGIATTVRVCLHEFGHALLWDHVNSPNFGWAHSAGDTLAAILNDPGSLAPDRFETFPFITAGTPAIDRRHDRSVAAGWAWGGIRDDTQYGSEQILSTLMFRIYRVTGGDDGDINVQRFAARYLAYLIVRAIGTLTATTSDPAVFVTAMENADELTTNFEGHPGGAWHKLIRWSFEKQGLFQPPGAPTPVTQPGAPPAVDVFVDDGRAGEYEPYLTDFGNSPGVWNRLAADGGTTNQDPVAGVTNHLYVRVGNRGTSTATGVVVKAYQGNPGSPLGWPGDWSPLTTASLPGPNIASGGNTVVGPFQWTPAAAGGLSVLASASATGDASNADTVNGPISNARLVPNDNNLAQRDLDAIGGGGGCFEICSGSTTPGATNWQAYGSSGLYLNVDTSACGFTATPRYFTSIGGNGGHWATTGATSIYRPTPTGFRVYVRWASGGALSPAQANSWRWHINWVGVVEG